MAAPTPSAALRVSKEVSPIWHVDYKQRKIAAWSDFSGCSFSPEEDPIDQLLKLEADKVNTVKQVLQRKEFSQHSQHCSDETEEF